MIIREIENDFEIKPILRIKEELFSETVKREYNENGYSFIINANFYDLSYSAKLDALNGNDAVPAEGTTPIGHVIYRKKKITGKSAKYDFYIASKESVVSSGDDFSKIFISGQGDTPNNVEIGFGGIGALILNGLEYGMKNIYKPGAPKDAILKGKPSPEARKFLIQRSSNKYISFSANDIAQNHKLGKTCIGVSAKGLYVLVQQHGNTGWWVQKIKDYFIEKKCIHAVFFDGSDSSLFYEDNKFLVEQGENKNETCIIGIGIKKLK